MKKHLLNLIILCSALFAGTAYAEVGVSVSIGQPGFYGQIDIGDFPRPQVIYAQPRIVHVVPYEVRPAPIYLRVPPGHYNNWGRYCGRYHACGRPVYFVQDVWYTDVYAPRYRERHYHDRDYDRRDHDHDRGDWNERGGKHKHGKGEGGKGPGSGHGRGHNK